jgi:hypothetical protein
VHLFPFMHIGSGRESLDREQPAEGLKGVDTDIESCGFTARFSCISRCTLSLTNNRCLPSYWQFPLERRSEWDRTFLEAWFAIWHDNDGQRRTFPDAEPRYQVWHDDAAASTLAPLRPQHQHFDADHFARLSAFLHNPAWESTNNAAERGGQALRHGQHPHFRLRSEKTIGADIKVRACLQKERFSSPPPRRLHHCQRGRSPRLCLGPALAA